MFEKVNRSGLIIYLYYNRDAKKLQDYGDITYHSKKHRYLQLYVPTQEMEQLVGRLGKEKFIKKVRVCHIQELETPFVGNLYRRKTLSSKKFKKSVDNFLIIRYILNMLFKNKETKKMKKKFALSFVALASVALLAACGEVKSGASNAAGNSVDEKTIKIGFNFEETGAVAAYGTSEQKGAQLAVDEINAAGGIDGKQIEVVDKDNKSETAEAVSVTTNLVTQSKVSAIVGPATSGATAAAVANATKAGVPLISPSATQDGLTKGQDYLFIGTFQDSFQGKIISNYVSEKLQAKKVVLYTDNASDYAKDIAKAFREAYKVKSLQMKLS